MSSLKGQRVDQFNVYSTDIRQHLSAFEPLDTELLSGLGLESVLTTSELADYLGVHVQAIYDLRTDGRGPSGIRVGREIRYRVSNVLRWLDGLHEPEPALSGRGGQRWAGRPRLPIRTAP